MKARREFARVVAGAAVIAVSWWASDALAQQKGVAGPGGYPVKPIRVINGSPAGSGSDVMMRSVAQNLGERLGQ